MGIRAVRSAHLRDVATEPPLVRRIRQLLRTAAIRRHRHAHDGAESQPPPGVLARHVKRAGPDGFLILEDVPGEPRGQGFECFIARLLTGGRGNRRQHRRQQQPTGLPREPRTPGRFVHWREGPLRGHFGADTSAAALAAAACQVQVHGPQLIELFDHPGRIVGAGLGRIRKAVAAVESQNIAAEYLEAFPCSGPATCVAVANKRHPSAYISPPR